MNLRRPASSGIRDSPAASTSSSTAASPGAPVQTTPLKLFQLRWAIERAQHDDPVDELPGRHALTGVQERRAELFRELQSILQTDVPYAFLYHTIDTTGFSNDVQGYVPIPEMRYMETVWLDR